MWWTLELNCYRRFPFPTTLNGCRICLVIRASENSFIVTRPSIGSLQHISHSSIYIADQGSQQYLKVPYPTYSSRLKRYIELGNTDNKTLFDTTRHAFLHKSPTIYTFPLLFSFRLRHRSTHPIPPIYYLQPINTIDTPKGQMRDPSLQSMRLSKPRTPPMHLRML
jgi:hypothetical protein